MVNYGASIGMTNDPFHWCALAAGSIARDDGKMDDAEYVKKLSYAMYEAVIKARKLCNTKTL